MGYSVNKILPYSGGKLAPSPESLYLECKINYTTWSWVFVQLYHFVNIWCSNLDITVLRTTKLFWNLSMPEKNKALLSIHKYLIKSCSEKILALLKIENNCSSCLCLSCLEFKTKSNQSWVSFSSRIINVVSSLKVELESWKFQKFFEKTGKWAKYNFNTT